MQEICSKKMKKTNVIVGKLTWELGELVLKQNVPLPSSANMEQIHLYFWTSFFSPLFLKSWVSGFLHFISNLTFPNCIKSLGKFYTTFWLSSMVFERRGCKKKKSRWREKEKVNCQYKALFKKHLNNQMYFPFPHQARGRSDLDYFHSSVNKQVA